MFKLRNHLDSAISQTLVIEDDQKNYSHLKQLMHHAFFFF